MKNTLNSMEINSIIFESNDSEIVVKGLMNQGYLQFESDVVISHSQLNSIINQMCAQNTDFIIENYIEANTMYDGETLYNISFDELLNRTICLNTLSASENVKQIRA